MVILWYYYGNIMVLSLEGKRRKSVVKRDFQRGEKHVESRGKTVFGINIWENRKFCVFLHSNIV